MAAFELVLPQKRFCRGFNVKRTKYRRIEVGENLCPVSCYLSVGFSTKPKRCYHFHISFNHKCNFSFSRRRKLDVLSLLILDRIMPDRQSHRNTWGYSRDTSGISFYNLF